MGKEIAKSARSKETSEAPERFEMVKARHKGTFEKAFGEGKVDERLVKICKHIAASKDYFTSSGCSGRIMLLGIPESGLKKEAYFHRKWHREVSLEEVLEGLMAKSRGELWLKAEGFILHIGCRDSQCAIKLLEGLQECGVKRAGIMAPKPGKWIVEAVSTQAMNAPVKRGSEVLVDEDYLKILVEKANKKMERNGKQLGKIEEWCLKEVK